MGFRYLTARESEIRLRRHIFLLMIFSLLLRIVSATDSASIIPLGRRNCADKCGNVIIPYPFGIGPGCYMDEGLSIICNTSFNPHKPFLSYHNNDAEILDISLFDGTVHINSDVYPVCTNNGIANIESINLGDNPHLFFSEKRNRFTALGCGVQGTIRENNQLIGGCMSICNDGSMSSSSDSNRRDGGCYGIECCQSMIPYGLKNFTLSISGTKSDRSNTTCKFVFLADETWYLKTSSSFSFSFENFPKKAPVVLDWKLSANQTCSFCGSNTNCLRDGGDKNSAIRCFCDAGFQGNPYLPQGCIDINECEDPNLHVCTATCINREGGYSCSCPSGYKGDGRRDGSGCVKIKWVTQVIIGICAAVGFLLLLILAVSWIYKGVQRRKGIRLKQKYFERNGGLLLQRKIMSSNEDGVRKTKHFTTTELEIATDKYNENRILGRGGQGTVYKGMLADGSLAAVKKSKVIDKGQLEEFINEVVILSQINHRNVVKLLGCCLETEVPILVYEFVPNGTLSDAIHNKENEFPMSWEMRLRIAAEMADAISYLHSAASLPIYHRDIKSTNILLDGKFRAKLSDFGTSRSVAVDQTHLTTQVKGTFGYFDPEYFRSSQFTERSDVYSFGVVLVELLTGKEPVFSITSKEKTSLASYFLSSLEENNLLDILDARLVKEGEEVMEVASLAKRCLDLNGRKRPLMKEVANTLEGIAISKGYLPTGQKRVEMDIAESNDEILGSTTSSEISYMDRNQSLITTSYSTDVELPLMYNTV